MPGAEGLDEPLRSRWSPSIFDAQHTLGDEEIRTLLHAAQWAPSDGNRQPWRFVVAERGSAAHGILVPQLSRGNSGWVPRASVVFIACAQVAPDEHGEGQHDPAYGYYDLGQAAAHLTLQARAMGLHAHQFKGFDRDAVAAGLGAPSYIRVVSGIAVGVRGEPDEVPERDRGREQKVRRRRPLAETAYDATWGRPWRGVSD